MRFVQLRPSSTESGSTLPMFAGLVFVGFVVIALATELALLGQTYRSAAAAADAAAEAGAGVISEAAAYESNLVLDRSRADQKSRSVAALLTTAPSIVEVEQDGLVICVTIQDRYQPRTVVFAGFGEVSVVVRSCAEPRSG